MKLFIDERGSYLVKFIFVFIALGGLAGLAVDGGRLYTTQIRLQAAVDAGTVAAISLQNNADETFLRDTAKELIVANLEERGLESDLADINVEVSGGLVTSQASYDVDLFLARAFLSGATKAPVRALAQGGGGAIQLVLALDTTGSMNAVTACDPNPDPEAPEDESCAEDCRSICYLKRAARKLVRRFNERATSQDRLSMVSYNQYADEVYEFARIDSDEATAAAIGWINGLHAEGPTCIACGIKAARERFENPVLPDTGRRYLVLMTDGASNQLLSGTHTCAVNNRFPQNNLPPDYELAIRSATYQAIVQADQARFMDGITIHTVGLGAPLFPDGIRCKLPYQENTGGYPNGTNWPCPDFIVRKPLLERIANDRDGLLSHEFVPQSHIPPNCAPPNADSDRCACIPRFGTDYPMGEFFEANSADQLEELFENVLNLIHDARLIR